MDTVLRLVSDSPCSSVLLSDWLLFEGAEAGGGVGGRAVQVVAVVSSLLGVTWKRPTVRAGFCSESREREFLLTQVQEDDV